MKRTTKADKQLAAYYDRRRALDEITEGPVRFALDEELRKRIETGGTKRRLQNRQSAIL